MAVLSGAFCTVCVWACVLCLCLALVLGAIFIVTNVSEFHAPVVHSRSDGGSGGCAVWAPPAEGSAMPGALLTLQGAGAYDAAVHCASVSAARRLLQQQQLAGLLPVLQAAALNR